jgi:hypothetical protein
MTWDTRVPVWQGIVKGKIVRIYDMEGYEELKRLYPDDPSVPRREQINVKPLFAKQKPQKRYNWIVPLEKPLTGRVEQKGRTA